MSEIDLNKPVETRNGRQPVVILSTKAPGQFSIVGHMQGYIPLMRWNLRGTPECAGDDHLVNSPATRTVFFRFAGYNLCEDPITRQGQVSEVEEPLLAVAFAHGSPVNSWIVTAGEIVDELEDGHA